MSILSIKGILRFALANMYFNTDILAVFGLGVWHGPGCDLGALARCLWAHLGYILTMAADHSPDLFGAHFLLEVRPDRSVPCQDREWRDLGALLPMQGVGHSMDIWDQLQCTLGLGCLYTRK